MARQATLDMWTVYEDPSDFPGKWVVRHFTVQGGSPPSAVSDLEPMIVADSLDEARKVIPEWAYCLGRHPDDDPAIYEVWT